MKLYVAIVTLLLGSIVMLNTRIDVAGLRTFDTVYAEAARQRPSELLVWPNLFDQRAWLKAKLERTACPKTLVLGSSTVGALRHEWFDGQTLLNGWMGAPTIEDFEAVAATLERARCAPRHVVIGVDHWLMNARFNDARWTSVASDYAEYHVRHGRPWLALYTLIRGWDSFKERLNYVTTRESLGVLFESLRTHRWRQPPVLVEVTPDAFCASISSVYYIRSYDGHYTTCPVFANSDAQVLTAAERYVLDDGHQIREWQEVDRRRAARLQAVVHQLRANGSQVLLLATPFHPITYRHLMADPRIAENFSTLDALLGRIARDESAGFTSLRDPERAGCAAAEFEDSHHGRPSCSYKVARHVVDSLRELVQP